MSYQHRHVSVQYAAAPIAASRSFLCALWFFSSERANITSRHQLGAICTSLPQRLNTSRRYNCIGAAGVLGRAYAEYQVCYAEMTQYTLG